MLPDLAEDATQLPTTLNGNQYVIVFSEYNQWKCFAIPNQRAETIAHLFVEQVICRYGVPSRLLSDQGSNFLSNLMKQVCQLMGVKKKSIPLPARLQTDRLVERFIGHYERCSPSRVDGAEWDQHLPYRLPTEPVCIRQGRNHHFSCPLDATHGYQPRPRILNLNIVTKWIWVTTF